MTAGNRPSQEDEMLILSDFHDLDVLDRHPTIPMLAWHLHTLKDMVRKGGRSHRSPVAKIFMRAVRTRRTMESVPFHHARKTFSLAQTDHIHDITGFEEESDIDLLSQFVPFCALYTEFI